MNRPKPRASPGVPLLYSLFFLSGIAGLGYEIVWTRMLSTGLGHEIVSLLAVIAAFFGGLALGAVLLDGVISRSRFPGRWYALLEIAIGLWGVITIALIPFANERVARFIGVSPGPFGHWLAAFGIALLSLLPATTAMGATLPAMDRLFSRLRADGRSVGGLYAMNTLGAVTGTLGATFLLIPAFGFRSTLLCLAGLDILCAGGILLGPARGEGERPVVEFRMRDLPGGLRLGATLAFTGFLGIGYEVLAVRVMAQALENTIYSFASALSVYLLGTSLGGLSYQALARRFGGRELLSWLFPATSSFCLLGIFTLASADRTYESLRRVLGGGNAGSIGAEMILALLVFFLPSIAMGATFSHLAQSSRKAGGGVGRALSLNTLGGALAPLVFGVLLLPALGSRLAILLVGLAYLTMLPDRRPRRLAPAVIPLILVPLLPGRFDLVQPPPGGRILESREGIMATVSVVEESGGNKLLKVNNRFRMGGSESAFGERRMGHIPLLLHPEPRRALFLGLGTAITFGASADYPGLSADGVELVPEVVGMLTHFAEANRDPQSRENLRIFVADARRFVQASERDYDVIVADLFHPARDGSGSLYTVEHFAAIRERLSPGGIFCQWLPLYQLDLDLLRLVTRTFLEVYPTANAFLAHFNAETPALALVGGRDERSYPPNWMEKRVPDRQLSGILQRDGFSGTFSLFACYVAGPQELREFSGAGPVNTDDKPRVTFEAPRVVYGDPAPPFAVLSELLETLHPSVGELIEGADYEFEQRLALCLEARDIYLRGDMLRVSGREDEAIDLYVRSATTSPDFHTGYAIAMVFARNLLRTDPERARGILEALNESNPAKPEAGRVLREAFGVIPR